MQPMSLAPSEPDTLATDDHHVRSGVGQPQNLTMQEPVSTDPMSGLPDDHLMADTQRLRVVGQHNEREPAPDVQRLSEHHTSGDVGLIVELWRQRQDLRRAQGRLNLQCQAVCRRASAGDKVAAGKLWVAIRRDPLVNLGLSMILRPYTGAMHELDVSAVAIEKQLSILVRQTGLWRTWAVDVRGIAELSFAGLIGEAARLPSEYRSVSALWKRMGLAVINGERQRLKSGEDALVHGYSPNRRAFAYVLSTNLMRSQKEDDPYRMIYDRRKLFELERGIPKAHAHNRSLRYMVKALLKDAWVASRQLHQS